MKAFAQMDTSSGRRRPAHRRPYGWTWFPSPRSRQSGRPSFAQSKIEPSSEYTSGCIHAGNRRAIIAERKPTEQYSTVLVRPRMDTSEAISVTFCRLIASGRWLMANSSGDRTSINRIACPGLSSHPANVAVSTRFTSGNAVRMMRLILPVSSSRNPLTMQGVNEIIGNTTFSLIFSKGAPLSRHYLPCDNPSGWRQYGVSTRNLSTDSIFFATVPICSMPKRAPAMP